MYYLLFFTLCSSLLLSPPFSSSLLPLQTNVALVSPLLRLENNHCHIDESEQVLKKAHKYSELIILYEKKGLHQKGETLTVGLCHYTYTHTSTTTSVLCPCQHWAAVCRVLL